MTGVKMKPGTSGSMFPVKVEWGGEMSNFYAEDLERFNVNLAV